METYEGLFLVAAGDTVSQAVGYVRSDGKLLRRSPRILDPGFSYLSSMPIWNLAEPVMEALVAQVQESSSAAVLDGTANRTSARVMQDTMLEPLLEAARTISQRLDRTSAG